MLQIYSLKIHKKKFYELILHFFSIMKLLVELRYDFFIDIITAWFFFRFIEIHRRKKANIKCIFTDGVKFVVKGAKISLNNAFLKRFFENSKKMNFFCL